jgi:bis(5'-nucleosyl)-tetraphosphatase (symmetrical)
MATYAVGDLQGCLKPLKCLLKEVGFDRKRDHLWLVGDLINRGPDCLETLRYLYKHRDCITAVLGNHDLHLLAVAYGYQTPDNSDTLDEILNADECFELMDWLRQNPLVHTDEQLGYTMVHAGIPPQWNINKANKRARELESVLRSDNFHDFLSTMYGNTPDCWDKDLEGADRWRAITNYFTRMRFCSEDGHLELKSKSGPGKQPEGYAPWFSHKKRKTRDDKIIFGHWAALEGKADTANIYALDTGCVWGGSMTMLRLEDEKLFSCKC